MKPELFHYLLRNHSLNCSHMSHITKVPVEHIAIWLHQNKAPRKNYRDQFEAGIFKWLILMGDTSPELKELLDEAQD